MPCLEDMPWMGMVQKLLHIFEQMCEEGVQISHGTFVYIISSCTYWGLVDEGFWYFDSMGSLYKILITLDSYAFIGDFLLSLSYH
jgi:hypothetical protein